MRAVVVTEHGGSDVLAVRELDTPAPGPGELLIEVAAAGVNFKDVYMREGIYPGETPFVLGDECAGRVVALGDGVTDIDGITRGDLVATTAAQGGCATHAIVPAAQAVPVPDGVDAELAAAALLQGMTAHYLVHSTYLVTDGDDVLVHAAAGGVGRLLVQMAKAQRARVIATVGSAAKVEVARAAGADEVLRTDETSDLAAAVRELVPDGVRVVYDGVGKDTFEASLASLHPRGTLALFGASSGQVPPFDLQRLNPLGSLFVTRPTLAHYVADRTELLERAGDVFAAVADGSLQIAVGGTYGLDDARRAYDDLEGRRTTGKLLIRP